jgi:hypothetical protein
VHDPAPLEARPEGRVAGTLPPVRRATPRADVPVGPVGVSAIRGLARIHLTGTMPGKVLRCPKCSGYGTVVVDPAGGETECVMCKGQGRIVTR